MGVDFELWMVDVKRYDELVLSIDALAPYSKAAVSDAMRARPARVDRWLAKKYLERLEEELDDLGVDANFDPADELEAEDNQLAVEAAVAAVFEDGVAGMIAKRWEIGRQPYGGKLALVTASIAELKPVRMLLDGAGFDVELPESCAGNDGWGIWGSWSPTSLETCLPALELFPTRDAVQACVEAIGAKGAGGNRALPRILGSKRQALARLSQWIDDDDAWQLWDVLRDAVGSTLRKRAYLTLVGS